MARERKFSTEDLYKVTRQLLLDHGYEGFTITQLAQQLELSRAAIYKYYDNREELLSAYMVYELERFLHNIEKTSSKETFSEQFDALFDLLFQDMSLYLLRDMGMQIQTVNKKIAAYKQKISGLHRQLYASLEQFVSLGKSEKLLRDDLPSSLVLGMIFQTVNIPNSAGLPNDEWKQKIKSVICHGMYTTH